MAEQLEFKGIYNGEADAINPSHYRQGGIECIDAMKENVLFDIATLLACVNT